MISSCLYCSWADPLVRLLNSDGLNGLARTSDGESRFRASAKMTFSGIGFLVDMNRCADLSEDCVIIFCVPDAIGSL